ncbi:unnamed protein product [Periconia digitata]|uniref:Uncharacterized protein n=1 Tax=Periconia digitata TaxID=1303443 RepID=A0A9W4U1P5_9PLEO|nr:unnamed protein product [Periconia digitata]
MYIHMYNHQKSINRYKDPKNKPPLLPLTVASFHCHFEPCKTLPTPPTPTKPCPSRI